MLPQLCAPYCQNEGSTCALCKCTVRATCKARSKSTPSATRTLGGSVAQGCQGRKEHAILLCGATAMVQAARDVRQSAPAHHPPWAISAHFQHPAIPYAAHQLKAEVEHFSLISACHAGSSMRTHQPCLRPQTHLEPVRGLLLRVHSAQATATRQPDMVQVKVLSDQTPRASAQIQAAPAPWPALQGIGSKDLLLVPGQRL